MSNRDELVDDHSDMIDELEGAPRQQKVYGDIIKNGVSKPSEVAERLGMEVENAQSALYKLREKGLLFQPKHGHYDIPSPGETESSSSSSNQLKLEMAEIEQVNVIAHAGAGGEVHFERVENVERLPDRYVRREFGVRPSRVKKVRVWGDSMEPTISSGEMVYAVLMEEERPRDGVVYLIHTPFGLVIKRLRHRVDDGDIDVVVLSSDNEGVEDQEILLDEFDARYDLVAYVPKVNKAV